MRRPGLTVEDIRQVVRDEACLVNEEKIREVVKEAFRACLRSGMWEEYIGRIVAREWAQRAAFEAGVRSVAEARERAEEEVGERTGLNGEVSGPVGQASS